MGGGPTHVIFRYLDKTLKVDLKNKNQAKFFRIYFDYEIPKDIEL